jgi:hypothetical protein
MTTLIRFALLCLLCGGAFAQSSLPPCQGSKAAWTNCFGTETYPSGNKYDGEFKDGIRNGQGTYTFANGDKFVGVFKDGQRNGQGTYFYLADNQLKGGKYVGEYKDDKRNGLGTFTLANGEKFVGEYKDDKRNGRGTFTLANGDKFFGEYKDGKRNGQGSFTSANGDKFFGEYKDDKPHGLGTANFANGNKFIGEFKDGKYNGQGTFNFANGNKFVGEFKDGKYNGQGTLTLANGGRHVGEWRDSLRHGLGIEYRADGTVISSGQWAEGKIAQSFALDTSRFPFNAPNQTSLPNMPSSAERDRLIAEVEVERKKRQELEQQVASSKERDRITAELDAERRKRQELEAQLVVPPQSPQASRRNAHALVIGNGAYAGSGRLENPVNDANAINQKLRSMGFTVTFVTDANRQKLVQAMAQFRRTASAADISLLFYAGHGVQIFGTNYILPTDVDQSDPAQATIQGVSLNSVVENFLPGKTKLVFLDACRDNPLQRTNERSVSKGLAPISAAEGTLISYATKDGQTAADGSGAKNSPFTQALLEHLNDPQDIAVVLRKVREKVMKATGGKQQPWEYGSLTGGELVLSRIKESR